MAGNRTVEFCNCEHKDYDHTDRKGPCIKCPCMQFEFDYYLTKSHIEPALLDILGVFVASLIVMVLSILVGAFLKTRAR
jgi:hypothetical protein